MKKTLMLIAALLPTFSHAGELKASLSFNKSAPFVAVAYIAGTGGARRNGGNQARRMQQEAPANGGMAALFAQAQKKKGGRL